MTHIAPHDEGTSYCTSAPEHIHITPSPEMRAAVLAAAGLPDLARRLARPSRPDELCREAHAFYTAIETGRYAAPESRMWVPIAQYMPADPYHPGAAVTVSVLYPRDPERGYRITAPEVAVDLITLDGTDTVAHEIASNIAGGKIWNAMPADDGLSEQCHCGEKFRGDSCRGCGAPDPKQRCAHTDYADQCVLRVGDHLPASNDAGGPDWHQTSSGRAWRA